MDPWKYCNSLDWRATAHFFFTHATKSNKLCYKVTGKIEGAVSCNVKPNEPIDIIIPKELFGCTQSWSYGFH